MNSSPAFTQSDLSALVVSSTDKWRHSQWQGRQVASVLYLLTDSAQQRTREVIARYGLWEVGSLDGFNRSRWTIWVGTGGRFHPQYSTGAGSNHRRPGDYYVAPGRVEHFRLPASPHPQPLHRRGCEVGVEDRVDLLDNIARDLEEVALVLGGHEGALPAVFHA